MMLITTGFIIALVIGLLVGICDLCLTVISTINAQKAKK